MVDEGPSPEDLRRFCGETAHCPRCGAEVWDEAPACPVCGEMIGGETLSRPPATHAARLRWITLVALLALAGLLLWLVF